MTEANAKKLQELEQEYARACVQLGEASYRKHVLDGQIDDLIKKIEIVQHEAYFLKKDGA